jgi:hypothetical protein
MSIERLNRAAAAAGFAMATPDDDAAADVTEAATEKSESRAVVLTGPVRAAGHDGLLSLGHWFKAHLPVWGWRAPA